MYERLLEKFNEVFGGGGDVRIYFAPGRVNLIGEHTDYNGGHVLPCALTMGTYGVVRVRRDRKLRFYSMNFEENGVIESSLDELCKQEDWTNYPKGVIWTFLRRGIEMEMGLDFLLYGTIPNGSGLSSSASVEVLTGYMLKDLFGFEITNQELAEIGQYAENEFVGMKCGIMDPFAVAMGKAGHAICLNTDTLEYEYIPVNLEHMKIVIVNSNRKRELESSLYNERRGECESAFAQIGEVLGINSLGDLTEELFEYYKASIKDEVCQKRAKHAVYENRRTIQAAEALKLGDIHRFGALMKESHISLRDDFEVTGMELDVLAEEAWKLDGVIGARMTGAGFGGCTVNLVKEEAVDNFIEQVGKAYREKIGYEADFYVAEIGEGPCRIFT